jgi:hypothetical protein
MHCLLTRLHNGHGWRACLRRSCTAHSLARCPNAQTTRRRRTTALGSADHWCSAWPRFSKRRQTPRRGPVTTSTTGPITLNGNSVGVRWRVTVPWVTHQVPITRLKKITRPALLFITSLLISVRVSFAESTLRSSRSACVCAMLADSPTCTIVLAV